MQVYTPLDVRQKSYNLLKQKQFIKIKFFLTRYKVNLVKKKA